MLMTSAHQVSSLISWQSSMQSPAFSDPSIAWLAGHRTGCSVTPWFSSFIPCSGLLSESCSQAPFLSLIALQESQILFSSLTIHTSTMEWLILQILSVLEAVKPGGCSQSCLAFVLLPSLCSNPSF